MDNTKLFKRAILSKTILVTMLFGSFSSFAMNSDSDDGRDLMRNLESSEGRGASKDEGGNPLVNTFRGLKNLVTRGGQQAEKPTDDLTEGGVSDNDGKTIDQMIEEFSKGVDDLQKRIKTDGKNPEEAAKAVQEATAKHEASMKELRENSKISDEQMKEVDAAMKELKRVELDQVSAEPAGNEPDDEGPADNEPASAKDTLPSNTHVNSNGQLSKYTAGAITTIIDNQTKLMQSYLASGEESEFLNNGVWISGLVGSSKDSKNKSKNKFQGGTVGYQRFADCSSIVGVALTKLNGANKSVDANLKNSSNLLSAYTLMQLDNFLLGAYVFGGKSQIKSSRYANKNLIATGKFSSYIYGAGGSLGYAIRSENHTLTPTAALNYYGSKAKAYKEKGVDAKSIAKQSDSSLVGNIGIRYSYAIEQDEMKIVPSVAVGVMRDLMSKSKSKSAISQASAENAGVFNLDKPKKKTSLYVRPDLTLKSELFDFSLAYGFEKAKKYTGHLGSAKLLVKF